MASNKRRRSSDGGSNSSSKFAAVQQAQDSSMFISLPAPAIPENTRQLKRRSPLTPPSVTPPSVTVSDSSSIQRVRVRYGSPTTRASTLLAKVAVVSSLPGTAPSSPKLSAINSPEASGLNSSTSTPTATPPDDGGEFAFSPSKHLPESPNGGYVSFPMFEAFGGYHDDDQHGEDGAVSPTRR